MGKELAVGITFGATLGFAIGWLGLLRADFALAVAVAAAMSLSSWVQFTGRLVSVPPHQAWD